MEGLNVASIRMATPTVRCRTPVRDPVLVEVGATRKRQQTPQCRILCAKPKRFSKSMRLIRARSNLYKEKCHKPSIRRIAEIRGNLDPLVSKFLRNQIMLTETPPPGRTFTFVIMEPILEPTSISNYNHCNALNCRNNANDNYNLSFFRFPKLLSRCKIWIANAKLANGAHLTLEHCYNHFRFCSEHFEEQMFAYALKNRLQGCNSNAIHTSSVCDAEGVFFTETWLADDVDNREFMDPAFVVYRSDRRFALVGRSIGGGVLSAFTEKLSVASVDASTLADLVPVIDVAICKCRMSFLSVYTVDLYIPPNIGLDDYETFIDALGIFLLDKQCILVGYFNAPGFNMPDLDDRRISSILLLMEILNLRHLNNTTNLNGRLLDVVLTNLDVEFTVAHDLAPFVNEDPHHLALDILINLDLPSDPLNFPSNTNLRYNFRKVDVPALCSELGAVDWDTLLDHGNVDCAVQIF
ncbi:hypothetical protein Trydic_g9856 [Trypoxylus dichotomus]